LTSFHGSFHGKLYVNSVEEEKRQKGVNSFEKWIVAKKKDFGFSLKMRWRVDV